MQEIIREGSLVHRKTFICWFAKNIQATGENTTLTVVEAVYKLGNGVYIIKEPKTAHSCRTVTLPSSMVELFKAYRADQELLSATIS